MPHIFLTFVCFFSFLKSPLKTIHFSHALLYSLPPTTPTPAATSTASVTTLPSGLTIVTETASPLSTISLTFPHAGSASESPSETGAALVNKNLAFKSGSGMSSALILRSLENEGATVFSVAGRDQATVGFTALPEEAVGLVPLLGTTCSLEKWDVKDAIGLSKNEVAAASTDAANVMTESLYSAAYGAQSALGKPYYQVSSSIASISSFRERAYGVQGAVLAATGIADHESFVSVVEEGLSEAVVPAESGSGPCAFLGGESRVHDPSASFANVALAFEFGGSSVLANVLQQCFTIAGVNGFTTPGMVGVYSSSSPADAATAVEGLVTATTTVATSEVIARAKGLAKAQALFGLEDGSVSLANVMAANVLESGSYSPAGLAEAYDAVSEQEVAAALKAIGKSRPAMAAIGNIASVPCHGSIVSSFE